MVGEIFRFDKDRNFKLTNQAYLIPEFRALWDKVNDKELYFAYIHFMLFPQSAYNELPESEKEQAIYLDYPIDKNNVYFQIAYDKAQSLYNTPLKRGFLTTKKVYETLINTMDTIDSVGIDFSKDGNYPNVKDFLSKSEQFMDNYKAVENKYKNEAVAFGSREIGYDDTYDYTSNTPELNI